MTYPTIDARAVWTGDLTESRKLYKQFVGAFGGRFYAICRHYGWKRGPMLKALRAGRS